MRDVLRVVGCFSASVESDHTPRLRFLVNGHGSYAAFS